MYNDYQRTVRPSGRHRPPKFSPESPSIQNLLLSIRRARRICRPYIPILLRAIIVIFAAIQLKPTESHDHIAPFASRAVVLSTILASFLSIIFFDTKLFNFFTVTGLICKFCMDIRMLHHISFHHLSATMSFHVTPILFSTFVGRRRSISKPSALRANISHKRHYLHNLKTLRNVDILEAGTRLQAALLVLDFSLSSKLNRSAFFFSLPFALLYLVGYSTKRNGSIVLTLLITYSVVGHTSFVLGFDFGKTIVCVAGALLGLLVGPGLLTVDEWLATSKQLCY